MSDEHRHVRRGPASGWDKKGVTCNGCLRRLRGDTQVYEVECTYPAGGRYGNSETKGFEMLCSDCYREAKC